MMKKMKEIFKLLKINLRTLLIFETLYRLIGLGVILPLARQLFLLSINLSGFKYITNKVLIDYLTNPVTVLVLFILAVILSFYISVELIFLTILFNYNRYQIEIDINQLISQGITKVIRSIKRYHVYFIVPAFIFFLLVELLHIVGIVSTISLPSYYLENVVDMPLLLTVSIVIAIIYVILFINTIYFNFIMVLDNKNISEILKENKRMLARRRLSVLFKLLILNVILNIILYIIYFIIILLIAGIVYLIRGQKIVFSIILTIIYSIYLIYIFLASIILIPLNYSFITLNFYKRRSELGLSNYYPENVVTSKTREYRFLKKGLITVLMMLLVFNVVSAIIEVRKVNLEIFHYPEIIAHRGASSDAPENTIAAIKLALEQEADAIEIDVRETKDKIPVLIHDSTTKRTTNDPVNNFVNNLDYDILKYLDAGSWFSEAYKGEKIPTLEEVLKLVKGRCKVFIELKDFNVGFNNNIVKIIERNDMIDEVTVASLNNYQLSHIKSLNSKIKTTLIVVAFMGNIKTLAKSKDLDNFAFEKSLVFNNPDYLEIIRNEQKKLYIWTVNSEDKLKRSVDYDVDGIMTDNLILTREIAYSKNKNDVFASLLKKLFSR